MDRLHRDSVGCVGRLEHRPWHPTDSTAASGLLVAANQVEPAGDVIGGGLVPLAHRRLQERVEVRPATRAVLREFQGVVSRALPRARRAAEAAMANKGEVNRLERTAARNQAKRLLAQEPNRVGACALELDTVTHLKRVFHLARLTARTVLAERAPQPERPGELVDPGQAR